MADKRKTDRVEELLFNQHDPYPPNEKTQAHLLDQYKLYLELADRVSARRQTANSYFLAINTALLSFVGYITVKDSSDYLWLLGAAGGVLCYFWYRLIRAYKDLNSAKFRIVHRIEKHLPISPFDAEWEELGRGQDPEKYNPLTHIEVGVPWVFFALHAYVFVRTVPWAQLRAALA
jgi:hypothetical protein